MRTQKAGLMITAFGLFLLAGPAVVIAAYVPFALIPLLLHPVTVLVMFFGVVFLMLGTYFLVIGKRKL